MYAKNYYSMAAMMFTVAQSDSTIKLHSPRSCNAIDKVMSRVKQHPHHKERDFAITCISSTTSNNQLQLQP